MASFIREGSSDSLDEIKKKHLSPKWDAFQRDRGTSVLYEVGLRSYTHLLDVFKIEPLHY